jgi:two-component system, sensor histidine kinase YesM
MFFLYMIIINAIIGFENATKFICREEKFMFKNTNLRRKLLLSYIALVVFPFMISTLMLSLTSALNIKNNTLSYINLFSEQISSNIDSYIGELDRMTRIAVLDDTLCKVLTTPSDLTGVDSYTANQHMNNEILKLMTQKPDIINITYIGANGSVYSGTSNAIQDMDLFNEITHAFKPEQYTQDLYISKAHIPNYLLVNMNQKNIPHFTITRFLYTLNKEYIGAIVLCISCQDLLDAININSSLIENGARIVITNRENAILADTSDEFIADNLGNSQYYTFNPSQDDPENMYFSSSSNQLTTTVIIDKDQLFKSTSDFNTLSMFLNFILILMIVVLSFYFSYHLMKPIKLLQHAATECASGNYNVKIPVYSQDEIGKLCNSFNFMTEQIQTLLDTVYHYQLATKQAQLEALQNQINPHFLHNTLEIIRMKALINKDTEVAQMVQTLAKLFRITLDRTTNIVYMKDELEHVTTYLAIQNMRFNNRFRFVSNVPENLLHCSIIKLTLQPLVENCIKHGFLKTFGDEQITIEVSEKEENLYIFISDNGVGIDPDNLTRLNDKINQKSTDATFASDSIGIVNIADRIRLEYGVGYYLRIVPNLPRGTTVELKIPKNMNIHI